MDIAWNHCNPALNWPASNFDVNRRGSIDFKPARKSFWPHAMIKKLAKRALMAASNYPPLRHRLVWKLPNAGSTIALTFDDGPDGDFTDQVLSVLSRCGVRATFFVLGDEIEKRPGIMARIVAGGHEVGLHGFYHSTDDLPAQVQRTAQVLEQFSVESRLFRPPFGRLNIRTLIWMLLHGYRTIMWSYDCRDSLRYEAKENTIPDIDRIQAGDIVLLHDDNPWAVDYLENIIKMCRDKNLKIVTVGSTISGKLKSPPAVLESG